MPIRAVLLPDPPKSCTNDPMVNCSCIEQHDHACMWPWGQRTAMAPLQDREAMRSPVLRLMLMQTMNATQAAVAVGAPFDRADSRSWRRAPSIVPDIPMGSPKRTIRSGEFFDERLLATIQARLGYSALALQEVILTAVDQFAGAAPQCDDLTVMVLVRDHAGTQPIDMIAEQPCRDAQALRRED